MTAADPRHGMLAEMGACAGRLGMAFGVEAERARTTKDRLAYFQLFDRCFFAMRVGIALELRLRREARQGQIQRPERDPPEDERAEPPEHERPECESEQRLDYTERDRDREAERASLPLLLRTLQGVVTDAAALPGPPPAALPTLQDLLARFSTDAAAPGPTDGQALRTRLTGSASAFTARPPVGEVLTLSPPRPPDVGDRPRRRRARGPPPG